MRDAVIVEAVRTPTGKRNGGLAGVHPADLSAHVLRALAERSGIDPSVVDDVIWGCVSQVGEQTFDIARTAVLSAGWPESVPGTTVDRQCGSSQQAVHFAAAGLIAGQYDVVVAGGVESMSRVPMGSAATANPLGTQYQERYGEGFPNQGVGAEQIATDWGITRDADGRVRAAVARPGRRRHRRGPLRRPDRAGHAARRHRGQRRRGHPPGRHDGVDGRRPLGVLRGRPGHRGQRLADLRRLGRAADDDLARWPPSSG